MDRVAVFDYGLDIAVHFTVYDTAHFNARHGVYFGGWTVIFNRGNILYMAPVKVQPCNLAPVCDWWVGVLFLCGAVWFNYRLPADWLIDIKCYKKPPSRRFLFFCIWNGVPFCDIMPRIIIGGTCENLVFCSCYVVGCAGTCRNFGY